MERVLAGTIYSILEATCEELQLKLSQINLLYFYWNKEMKYLLAKAEV